MTNTEGSTQATEQRIAGLTKEEFKILNIEHNGALKIWGIEQGDHEFDLILRKPSQTELDQHVLSLSKLKDKDQPATPAMRNFTRLLAVAPESGEIDGLFAKYPMVVTQIYTQIMKEAGSDAEVKEKTFR